jgi:hypothetical protein
MVMSLSGQRGLWGWLAGGLAQDVVGLRAFVALNDVEEHFVALFQVSIAVFLDRTEVHEDIGAVFTADEPIALKVVEPLYGAFVSSERIHGEQPFPLEESKDGGSRKQQDSHFVGVRSCEPAIRSSFVREAPISS